MSSSSRWGPTEVTWRRRSSARRRPRARTRSPPTTGGTTGSPVRRTGQVPVGLGHQGGELGHQRARGRRPAPLPPSPAGRPRRRGWSRCRRRAGCRPGAAPTPAGASTRSTSEVSTSKRGMAIDEHLVEVLAATRRALLDEMEIVGREHRHPHGVGQVGPAADGLAVDLSPGRSGDRQLGFDQDLARRPTTVSARTMARDAPARTRTSRGAPRSDRCVASQPTASRTDVLPDPFGPRNTVRPCGSGSTTGLSETTEIGQPQGGDGHANLAAETSRTRARA